MLWISQHADLPPLSDVNIKNSYYYGTIEECDNLTRASISYHIHRHGKFFSLGISLLYITAIHLIHSACPKQVTYNKLSANNVTISLLQDFQKQ